MQLRLIDHSVSLEEPRVSDQLFWCPVFTVCAGTDKYPFVIAFALPPQIQPAIGTWGQRRATTGWASDPSLIVQLSPSALD
jgi:hypothetical protein